MAKDGLRMAVVIRAFRESDLAAVVRCFTESVRVIAARYYDAEQIEAWAPLEPDLASWRDRLSDGHVLVAEAEASTVAGFVRVEPGGIIDLLYVHPQHERRGVGRSLLDAACSWARAAGARRLESDVSLAARALFEAAGFHLERAQHVRYRGVTFRNFHVVREADVDPAA